MRVKRSGPNRTVLVPVSIIFLSIPMQVLSLVSRENQVALALPISVYVSFIILVGTIQTLIAMRLYRMHELRRFVFDIQTWFLVASLLACPLAVANFFAYWLYRMESGDSPASMTLLRWITALVLYFMFLPIFFITEWLVAAAGQRNAKRDPPRKQ